MINSNLLLEAFKDEILRWNRQINLVSRQETGHRLDSLFEQCVGGHEAVDQWINHAGLEDAAKKGFYYFDLGSGGGLPGIIWHVHFSQAYENIRSFLVEPRDKRAWFINRQNRISNMPDFETLQGRWGEVFVNEESQEAQPNTEGLVVVSLKALHLNDPDVLGGLDVAFSAHPESLKNKTVLIARFYPPDQSFDSDLVDLLSISSTGRPVAVGDYIFKAKDSRVISLCSGDSRTASLVLSSYLIEGS